MAVASWMLRSRNLRSGRFDRSRKESDEDAVRIDLSKDVRINCKELLEGICRSTQMSEAKKLNYLNSFVKLILHIKGEISSTGFTMKDILHCLRVPLVHQSTQVRAGCLRAIRHVLNSEEDVCMFNDVQYPLLVARSLDVVLRNEVERIQAMKLIRKVLVLSPVHFDTALARSLVSLANGVAEEKDRMLRACLAALCELAVLNASLFISCGGVTAITRNILDCQMPRIVECLCGVLLHLLQTPETRRLARVDLHCLAAPYCDFHYRHAWMDKNRDERELRFNCSRLALLSVLRSWPGILHFCSPRNASGLRAIVQVLYLDQLEVRKAVLDLLYELLGLPQPDWTDEYSVALNAVDPADPQDCWRLGEGFVVAEGRSIVPHLARCTPNIADIHLAVLLYAFLENGLLGALVEVIISSDTFISVRATILLGELLHLMHALLPPECCDVSPALPGLLAPAGRRGHHQALAAVTALNQLHALLKRRPASASLYLDHILRAGQRFRCTGTGERTGGNGANRAANLSATTSTSRSNRRSHRIYKLVRQSATISSPGTVAADLVLHETGVLESKEGFHSWNWEVIGAVLRRDGELSLSLDDTNHRLFIRRLVHYFQPSSNQYSHLDLNTTSICQSNAHTAVGCELVRCLVAMTNQPESTKLLLEWFSDIASHVDAISTSKSAHDCLFSPQHMSTTLCQTYFLFIGHMCHSTRGISLLQEIGLFTKLTSLASSTNHVCYVKLIVSSFNYAIEGPHRLILGQVLKCKQESSRLYATQFILILLRATLPNFEQWGIELLVQQLFDRSKSVALTALNIAHEACERRVYLERLVELRPNLSHLGDKGLLLQTRLVSLPHGLRVLGGSRHALSEIARWADHFVYRYVHLVEAELLDSLTLHQRSEDGRYDRRHSSNSVRWSGVRRDVYIPPHLYGQLAHHEQGYAILVDSGRMIPLVAEVIRAALDYRSMSSSVRLSERQVLELKAAMWACGHVAATPHGVQRLIDDGVFRSIVDLAEWCPVYSLRGTAVYVLGLMATTYKGANELFSLGWACVRHGRHDRWPVVEEEDWSRVTSCEEDVTTISSSDNVPAWAVDMWADDAGTPIGRSSTLPSAGISAAAILAQHKRSLSESHRNRDNSCNESIAESVISSCDSSFGPNNPHHQQVHNNNNNNSCRLSPIPSSSSLSTLKTGLEMMRGHNCWTADGPRRVSLSAHSCSNSNSLTISPPDTNGSRLSHQDLLGYTTLRTLRRVRASSFRSDSYSRQLNSSTSGFEEGLVEDALFGGPSGPLFVGNVLSERPPLRDFSTEVGQCYMGICLPRQLYRLFPEDQIFTPGPELSVATEELGQNNMTHESKKCLLCADFKSSTEEIDQQSDQYKLKSEVLKHVERLSNPVWCKQSKQALLHLKQRHASVFQDVCLYSEVCTMVGTTSYRLSARRFLQELFLDLNYEELLSEQNCALRERLFPGIGSPIDPVTEELSEKPVVSAKPLTNIMEGLKLTCSENKFPITQRNQTVNVPQSYSLIKANVRSPELSFKNFSASQSLLNSYDSSRQTCLSGEQTPMMKADDT